MTIARRHILGMFAAGAATALAGCGGGDDGPPRRIVRVLNVNPDFALAQVEFSNAVIAPVITRVDFPHLSDPLDVAFGTYTVTLRDLAPPTERPLSDNIRVDADSPSVEVFYRTSNSSPLGGTNTLLLESTPPIILNYSDLDTSLTVKFDYGSGNVLTNSVLFGDSLKQPSDFPRTARYRLRVLQPNGTPEFDSGDQLHSNTRVIVLFPYDSANNRVGVIGLNYGGADLPSIEEWRSVI